VPIGAQVGVVAALFVAALVVLWTTDALVVGRERRRSEAKAMLDRAGQDPANAGREAIAQAGDFLDFHDEESRATLDRRLSAEAATSLAPYNGIDSGYWVVSLESFLGAVLLPDKARADPPDMGTGAGRVTIAESD
jgi:two-component system, NtrC family, sensor histidine kinase HydH